ncbi:MAG: molecular chaperone TorD family protein [Burkholderiales bacterium]|nr:molecular chaperone TorD family protein [Burkholderiales bacterium]
MSADSAALPPALAPEDAARANFYGLLARLLYAPPDRALLGALAGAGELAARGDGPGLALAWRELKAGAATAEELSVRDEFETLYIGTGKALVSPYAGAYLSGARAVERLVALRQYLAERGLARQAGVHEPEDHVAALCDVMRHLIAEQHAPSDAQREFFAAFVWPAAAEFCNATEKAEPAAFYRLAVRFGRSFLEVEHTLFELE